MRALPRIVPFAVALAAVPPAAAAENLPCNRAVYDAYVKNRTAIDQADKGEFRSPETIIALRRLEEEYCLAYARCETMHPAAEAAMFSGCLIATEKPTLGDKKGAARKR